MNIRLHRLAGLLPAACLAAFFAWQPGLGQQAEQTDYLPLQISPEHGITLRSTIVALAAEPSLRREFERGLTDKALAHGYSVVASYEIVPDLSDFDDPAFVDQLVAHGIGAVLMIRPAAVGPGTTLESVRDSVSPATYSDMRAFARRRSRAGGQDVLAVVHLGAYLISERGAELLSSGAVWLDEPNPSRAQGIDRLQNLILANVDAIRPAIRAHLGLPPLTQ